MTTTPTTTMEKVRAASKAKNGHIVYSGKDLREIAQLCETQQKRIEELEDKMLFTYCAYCGVKFECDKPDSTKAIGEHIHNCPKHPIAGYKKDLAIAVEALEEAREKFDNNDCGLLYNNDSCDCGLCIIDKALSKLSPDTL